MMTVMKMPKINLRNLTSIFLLMTSFFSVLSAPLKPLNERSKELTWQAWLLVDDQNQNKQYDPDGLIRRRITPKSVFIAPTFSPSDLPACADGYTSDSMGRCVKLFQLDENAHLKYLLERLREQFGNFSGDDYDYDVDEEKPTPGPFQFNIPLDEVEQEGSSDDTNVAIVVAPTNGSFNMTMNDFKVNNVKRDQNGTTDSVGVPIIITKINVDDSAEKNTSVSENGEEITTTEDSETTTMEIETTPMAEEQAIFFKIPQNNTKTTIDNFDSLASENKQSLNIVKFPEVPMQDSASNDHPTVPNHQQLPLVEMKNKFRDDDAKDIISQLLPHANVKTTGTLFDDTDSNVQHNFNHRDTSHQSTDKPQHRVFNHRNRDKWLFPPAWQNSPPQKPLVLRFNHLPSNTQNTHFYEHQPRQEGMYRKVPPQDLSYIFGIKDTHR